MVGERQAARAARPGVESALVTSCDPGGPPVQLLGPQPARDRGDVSNGSRMRGVWQAPVVGHECQPLAPANQASVEPQHPACARPGRRRAQADPRLHGLHQGRQDREAGPLTGGQRSGPDRWSDVHPSATRSSPPIQRWTSATGTKMTLSEHSAGPGALAQLTAAPATPPWITPTARTSLPPGPPGENTGPPLSPLPDATPPPTR